MAETIVIFLWILLDSDIDEDVLPSITGLANLYTWQSRANKSSASATGEFYEPIMNCDFPVLGIDLVFHVLSGLAIPGTPPKHESLPTNDYLARVGNGICVYHCAIEDPNLPLETIFRFRVVRGYISFSGFRFKEICGFRGVNVDSSLKAYDLRGEAPIRSVQTIAQETENETRLEMAYLVHYLNETAQLATCWLHLPFIFRKLQRKSTYLDCAGNCPALYELESTNRPHQLHHTVESWPSGINREEYDRAQEMLNGFKHAGGTWIRVSSAGLFTIITGHPILLYALINPSTLCLLPFKDCLSCIMRRAASINHVYDYTGQVERYRRTHYHTTAKFLSLNPFSESTVSWAGPTSEAYA